MRVLFAKLSLSGLSLLRLLTLIFIIYNVIALAISLPAEYARLSDFEPGTFWGNAFYGWTGPQIQAAIGNVGLRPAVYAALQLAFSLICLSFYWMMAGLLLWRKSDSLAGLLAAYVLFFTGPGFSGLLLSETQAVQWMRDLSQMMAIFTWPTFFVILYIFPNGKFVPRFTGYLFWLPYMLFILSSFNAQFDTLGTVILAAYATGGLASQVYRYRMESTAEGRQQTKWVVFVLSFVIFFALLTPVLLVFYPNWVVGSPERFWYEFIGNGLLGVLLPAFLPLAIGISILRYHLWDIDVIIRRTLVYAALSASLALVYFGSVVLLEALLRPLAGGESQLAIILTTLAIAALFNPLRRRIQDFIDRRFYRQKYNAEQALAEFATAARAETDLEQLLAQLTETVQETLQPEQVSLWLTPVRYPELM